MKTYKFIWIIHQFTETQNSYELPWECVALTAMHLKMLLLINEIQAQLKTIKCG